MEYKLRFCFSLIDIESGSYLKRARPNGIRTRIIPTRKYFLYRQFIKTGDAWWVDFIQVSCSCERPQSISNVNMKLLWSRGTGWGSFLILGDGTGNKRTLTGLGLESSLWRGINVLFDLRYYHVYTLGTCLAIYSTTTAVLFCNQRSNTHWRH